MLLDIFVYTYVYNKWFSRQQRIAFYGFVRFVCPLELSLI